MAEAGNALAGKALAFVRIVTGLALQARQPGFATTAWDELLTLIATDSFRMILRDKRELDLPQSLALLDDWARRTDFSCAVQRVEEAGRLVFVELDETTKVDGQASLLNTITVFEFNEAGQLHRLDCFQ